MAVVFADVFERWPDLESYDVCQEPNADGVADTDEPLPVTQIELTKAENAAIDWDSVTVVDLVRQLAGRSPRPGAAGEQPHRPRPGLRRHRRRSHLAPEGRQPGGHLLGQPIVAPLEVVALAVEPHVA